MDTVNIKLYDFARHKLKLNEADAKEFIQVLDEAVQADVKNAGTEYRSAIKEDLLQLEIRLSNKMADQFKWVIGIFITLALMIVGLYLKK